MARMAALSLILFTCYSPLTFSAESLSVGVGRAESNIDTARLAVEQPLNFYWFNQVFPGLQLNLEYSGNFWHHPDENYYAFSLLPSVRWHFNPQSEWQWFADIGVGPSYISDKQIQDHDMGSNWQFEDRIGFGVQHDSLSLAIRGYHYSNAGLCSQNDGINMVNLELNWRLP